MSSASSSSLAAKLAAFNSAPGALSSPRKERLSTDSFEEVGGGFESSTGSGYGFGLASSTGSSNQGQQPLGASEVSQSNQFINHAWLLDMACVCM